MEFDFDSRVTCFDGSAGSLVGLMTDPVERILAHIAVEPSHHPGRARLVVASLVVAATRWGVTLGCSREDVDRMPEFRDVEFFPHGPEYGEAGADLAWPDHGPATRRLAVFVDRVPAGEFEIHRGEPVHAADGAIGRVEGVGVDDGGRITHLLLLQEGHLWGRREVAIAASSLERIDASGIHTPLSKHQVAALPEIGVDLSGSRRGLA